MKLVPVQRRREPAFGSMRGQIHYSDDYDQADAQIAAMFGGSV